MEFADTLRADEVLQKKARSMGNIDIIMSARTTEVIGDGSKVVGMDYEDRTTGEIKHLAVAGIFVQIGLVPNTEFLKERRGPDPLWRDRDRHQGRHLPCPASTPQGTPPRCRSSRSSSPWAPGRPPHWERLITSFAIRRRKRPKLTPSPPDSHQMNKSRLSESAFLLLRTRDSACL